MACKDDRRVKVDPKTSPPYNWICSLYTKHDNKEVHASGFKIHIPNVTGYCIIMTSGHCVYDVYHQHWRDNITVKFPGQEAVTVRSENVYAPPEYIANRSKDHDYGIIILPGDKSDEGFGWSAIISDQELSGRIVTNCGYPYDRYYYLWPQVWITGREITQVTANRLYMNDTAGCQSGSPVYTWYKGYWTVVGVHCHEDCPNSAARVTADMIYRFLERTQNLKKYSLKSAQFYEIYIRCNGSGIKKAADNGAGTINCQHGLPSNWETFYIYPVEVTPSLAKVQTYIVVLKNCKWPNTFVRMDGRDITKYENCGGGVVNCQWSGIPPSSWESFVLEKDKRTHLCSFQSVEFPHRYIRIDGSGVFARRNQGGSTINGGGIVNCQYYDKHTEKKGPTSWEQFSLEEQ